LLPKHLKPNSTILFACSVALASSLAYAEPLPPVARSEVLGMLKTLEASGCQFNRNGKWYSGPDAKTHLLRKLDYVESKHALKTAEQFIDLAASESSFSGIAYQVRCAGATSIDSNVWMKKELRQARLNK
jgi:hypothetical protein